LNRADDLVGASKDDVATIIASFMNSAGGWKVLPGPTMGSGRKQLGSDKTTMLFGLIWCTFVLKVGLFQPSFVSGHGRKQHFIGHLGVCAFGGSKAALFRFGTFNSFSAFLVFLAEMTSRSFHASIATPRPLRTHASTTLCWACASFLAILWPPLMRSHHVASMLWLRLRNP